MTDKEKFHNVEKDGHTLVDDPLEYCREIYAESSERVNELEDVNVENLDFYEGKDPRLEERRNDPNVKRSAIFFPQLTPAIDARIGDIVSSLEERDIPVILRPLESVKHQGVLDLIAKKERQLDLQLRDSGYIAEVFIEHAMGAEIFRTPSVVKVGWDFSTEPYPVIEGDDPESGEYALVSGEIKDKRVMFERRDVGQPYCEWIPSNEFLYEPGVSIFDKESRYAGHRKWMTRWEIMSSAKQHGYDMKAVKKFFDDDKAGAYDEWKERGTRERADDDQDWPHRDWMRDRKYLIVEWYIVDYNEAGDETVRKVVVLGDQVIVQDKPSPYKGFKFPFVLLVANRRLGSLENTPTIERGKDLQVLFSEVGNSHLDGMSYRTFPVFQKEKNCKIHGSPVWQPGEIISYSGGDGDGLRPVMDRAPQLPDLPIYMESIAMRIRDVTNSQDTQQGIASSQYEKATKTKMRAVGSARRAMPTRKRYGQAICEVAKKYIALNQQFADDAALWVLPVRVDVPSLTSVTDLEQEKQDAMLLYSQMMQDPLFQSANGARKRSYAWRYVVRTIKKDDVANFVLSDDELKQDIQNQVEQQSAMLDKQSVQEQIALEAQNAPGGVS